MAEVLVSIRGLTIEFRVPRGILRAVDEVNLDIYKGEILGLVGESGCGKSVLAHAIIKQVDPNGYIKSGKVFFEGKDVFSMSEEELRRFRWKDVAIIFQGAQNALNPVMHVFDHMVDTVLDHEKIPKKSILERSLDLLKMVRLDAERVLKLYPHELSGGMKQRVISAMSLLLNPKFLILDEPTSSLDVLTQKYFLRLIRDIHDKMGITMLFITHDLGCVAEVADRIAVMYLANIIEVGNAEEIFYDPKHPYTAALIRSIPSTIGKIGDVKPIPGPIPDPVLPPPGCRFHPRCQYAFDKCRKEKPDLINIGNGRLAACHLFSQK
ncbi:MAG: ABC transporter ATP-binding protein [Candidatus Bathyarchaeia archaeon]